MATNTLPHTPISATSPTDFLYSYEELEDETVTEALDTDLDMTNDDLAQHDRLLVAYATPSTYRTRLLNRLTHEVTRQAIRAGEHPAESLPRIAAMEASRQALQVLMEHDPALGHNALAGAISVLDDARDLSLAAAAEFPLLTV